MSLRAESFLEEAIAHKQTLALVTLATCPHTIPDNAGRGRCVVRSTLLIFFIIVAMGCGGMKYKVVNTRHTVSTGFTVHSNIYFLCDYGLYQPGRQIIPMYMYSPGDVYMHALYLYSYTPATNTLKQVLQIQSPVSTNIDISNAAWVEDNGIVYCIYSAGWDNIQKKVQKDVLSFNINAMNVIALSNYEKQQILKKYGTRTNKNHMLSQTDILYYVDHLPMELWLLPSPLTFCTLDDADLKEVLVQGIGDSNFKEVIFAKLQQCSKKELLAVAAGIEKRYKSLESYQKMEYAPYRERWVTRILLAAFYGLSADKNLTLAQAVYHKNNDIFYKLVNNENINYCDQHGTTLCMIAAYADNIEVLSYLLKANADMDAQDAFGCTALMYAVFGRAAEAMGFLIKNNADTEVVSGSNCTAWVHIDTAGMRKRYVLLTEQKVQKKQ
jgi:hypothetical protein